MNNILNNKINYDLTRIIGSYNLKLEEKNDFMTNLKYLITNIKYVFDHNQCFGIKNQNTLYNDLENIKIFHYKTTDKINDWWTIRKNDILD